MLTRPDFHASNRLVTLEEVAAAWQCDARTLYRRLESEDIGPVDHTTGTDGITRPRFNAESLIRIVLEQDLVPLDRIIGATDARLS